MSTSPSAERGTTRRDAAPARNPLFSALIGLASLAIFLQAVWAGMMIREGEDYTSSWVTVHSVGARVALVLALAATIVAIVRLRARRDLVIGAAVLTVLIFVESFVGAVVGDHPAAVALHIPLAFAIFGLAVWLPLRTTHRA